MQTFADLYCPYCGERIDIAVDVSAGAQDYVEDCQVCCRPIVVSVQIGDDGMPTLTAQRDDEA